MSTPEQTVFRDCFFIAKELERAGRLREGESVLRALAQFLDVTPSMPDRSDKKMIDRYIVILTSKLKAQP